MQPADQSQYQGKLRVTVRELQCFQIALAQKPSSRLLERYFQSTGSTGCGPEASTVAQPKARSSISLQGADRDSRCCMLDGS